MLKPCTIFLFCFGTLITADTLSAQELFSWNKENNYCNPSVIGLPRAKAIVLKYEMQTGYSIRSTGQQGGFGDGRADVGKNERFDFRLRFPIVNKPSLTIAAGLKYSQEEFSFKNIVGGNYPFYRDLEDRSLRSVGLHFYVLKPTKTNRYFILRASLDLNGDYNQRQFSIRDFLKFSLTPLIGWKKNENLSYAVGFSYGYTFGRPLIFPVLSINKNFNCNFGIETVLPVSIKLRYTLNEKNYFYTGLELNGASYRLNSDATYFTEYSQLHLFRSELRYTVNYEREIHDWLWFGLEAGMRHTINYNLTNGPRGRSDIIIKNKLQDSPVFNASIFLVPPRGLLTKRK